ncbi:SgcJ/EcaC family oxidoreductase [Chryseobacterium sp. L7]|uniref:SgcJ/EcaC family oxidoreductase n=1 Tax=Chryseobacterium endalhagicum TaxID=2797638 RepID=A0ABS1QEA2_9FLAO|nr:SgcJ/EcaC family oxidoreductase [Chryseobacterium endalhagicum]MBL1220934.1 SgcJ/EcaC family oxidoreductase [Chryseobacterium endalhagicum]
MKKILTAVLVACILSACSGKKENNSSTINTEKNTAMETDAKKNIEETLKAYENALNASSTEQVLPLYTQNGIFMPQGGPTAEGQEQLKGAYDFVFKTLQLNVKFRIDEMTVINENYAIARTMSKGTQLIHAENKTTPEENRELFVLEKEDGQWKIARYMFNKSK